jgi:tRNA U34 5-carboxymethylaminomethyl modifying enzyme MnmG/GidA
MKKMEDREINPEFDYSQLVSLSKEAREKLKDKTTHFGPGIAHFGRITVGCIGFDGSCVEVGYNYL